MIIMISRLSAISTCSSFKCVTHLVNGLKFLKQTKVLLFPFTTAISPVTRIYAHIYHKEYITMIWFKPDLV